MKWLVTLVEYRIKKIRHRYLEVLRHTIREKPMQYLTYFLPTLLISLISIGCGGFEFEGTIWTHEYGDRDAGFRGMGRRGIAIDAANNSYIVGSNEEGLALRKYDGNGNEIWTQQVFGTEPGRVISVTTDGSESVYVTSQTPLALRKFNLEGKLLWTKGSGIESASDRDYVVHITTDVADNVFVVGISTGILPGDNTVGLGSGDAYIRKYDADGVELWTHRFRGQPVSVATDRALNVYVAGITRRNGTSAFRNMYLKKFDGEGRELWTRQFTQDVLQGMLDLKVDSADNVYTLSRYIRKYDHSGEDVWTLPNTAVPGRNQYWARAIAPDSKGNIYLLRGFKSNLFVRKYDTHGNEMWTHDLGYSEGINVDSFAVDNADNLYMTGSIYQERDWSAFEPGWDIKGTFLTKIRDPSKR